MKSYYYFYTSLRDLSWDIEKKPYSAKELIQKIQEALEPEDFEIIRAFLYRFDNKNLVKLIEKKDDFSDLGIFSKTELEEEIKNPTILPRYMKEFLENLKSDRKDYGHYSLEDQLSIYYYKFLMNNSDDFIRAFTRFDFNLKNLLVALNCRKYKLDLPQNVLLINEEAESLISSGSGDFGLSLHFSWLSEVIRIFEESSTLEFQKKLDQLIFDQTSSMVTFEYFTVRVILAYLIKFMLIDRHLELNDTKGINIFENITKSMVEKVNLSAE